VCAFDKTGTLTADEFTVNGLVLLQSGSEAGPSFVPAGRAPLPTLLVLAGCHAVMPVDNGPSAPSAPAGAGAGAAAAPSAASTTMAGDPLERATLAAIRWTVGYDGTAKPMTAAAAAGAAGAVAGSSRSKLAPRGLPSSTEAAVGIALAASARS
jgi:magnesium-transporting ATPase (P-type)